MKIKTILFSSLLLLSAAACTVEEIRTDENRPEGTVNFDTRGPADHISVLIFRQQPDNTYRYQEKFVPTWTTYTPASPNAGSEYYRATKNLLIGDYEFLFYNQSSVSNTTITSLGAGSTQMNDIRFSAVADGAAGAGYYLPVDETWLPETTTAAHTPYSITGTANPTVEAKLTRAVAQVEIVLKRGTESGGVYTPVPFSTGDIRDIIGSVTLDLENLGTTVDYAGTGLDANAKTKVTLSTANTTITTVDADGFATITGPFVFPNNNPAVTEVDFDLALGITPAAAATYTGTYTGYGSGTVERNKKLQITVWFTASGGVSTQDIKIEVVYGDLGNPTAGDSGIWE